jgi:hypothetical protein
MNKTFGELSVGDRFTFNGQEFIKTNDIRISCCKTVNACAVNNRDNTIYVQPSSEVRVNA